MNYCWPSGAQSIRCESPLPNEELLTEISLTIWELAENKIPQHRGKPAYTTAFIVLYNAVSHTVSVTYMSRRFLLSYMLHHPMSSDVRIPTYLQLLKVSHLYRSMGASVPQVVHFASFALLEHVHDLHIHGPPAFNWGTMGGGAGGGSTNACSPGFHVPQMHLFSAAPFWKVHSSHVHSLSALSTPAMRA